MTVLRERRTAAAVDLDRWPGLRASRPAPARAAAARALIGVVARKTGIRVELADGDAFGPVGGPVLRIAAPTAFFTRLGRDGKIGFGESYMNDEWDSPELVAVLERLARNVTSLVPAPLQRLRRWYDASFPAEEDNDRTGAKRNITRHYDLSNELFAAFLDESMTYSSALFADLSEPLETAQRRKIDRLLDLTRVGPGSTVLEIGTGWGELAIRAARRGASVHSITLSVEQLELAEERVAAAGLTDLVRIELRDYRALAEPQFAAAYDAILSVEMIEAVGHEFWGTYFQTIDHALAPGGRLSIQAITMPHDRMLATRGTQTWINKYVFPGGFLPSTDVIEQVTRDHTSLRVSDRLDFGHHYAETLRQWDHRFLAARGRVLDLGFDEIFVRMWHFYLEYSRAGFASGYLDVQQLTLARLE